MKITSDDSNGSASFPRETSFLKTKLLSITTWKCLDLKINPMKAYIGKYLYEYKEGILGQST